MFKRYELVLGFGSYFFLEWYCHALPMLGSYKPWRAEGEQPPCFRSCFLLVDPLQWQESCQDVEPSTRDRDMRNEMTEYDHH